MQIKRNLVHEQVQFFADKIIFLFEIIVEI